MDVAKRNTRRYEDGITLTCHCYANAIKNVYTRGRDWFNPEGLHDPPPPSLLPECALTLVSQPENEVSVTHFISHSSVTLIKKAHVVGSGSAGSESNIGSIPPEADGKILFYRFTDPANLYLVLSLIVLFKYKLI